MNTWLGMSILMNVDARMQVLSRRNPILTTQYITRILDRQLAPIYSYGGGHEIWALIMVGDIFLKNIF